MVEVVITTIEDEFRFHFRKYFRRREYLVIDVPSQLHSFTYILTQCYSIDRYLYRWNLYTKSTIRFRK